MGKPEGGPSYSYPECRFDPQETPACARVCRAFGQCSGPCTAPCYIVSQMVQTTSGGAAAVDLTSGGVPFG